MRSSIYLASLVGATLAASASAQISAANVIVKVPVKTVTTGSAVTPIQLPSSTLVGGSDDCTTADAISGPGTYAVNTTAATTGSPVGSCGLMGSDVWFRYTAVATSVCNVSTCGGSMDSVIAIWAGAPAGTCPSTQIACLDDACGLQTSLSFAATAGTAYYFELGGFNAQTYSGTFTVAENIPSGNDACAAPTVLVGKAVP